MAEVYGSLWTSVGSFVQSWALPSILGVAFFSLVLLPAVENESPWSGLADPTAVEGAALFSLATLVLSFALASTSRPLFRLLEGYTLRPLSLRQRWTASQRTRRNALIEKIQRAPSVEEKLQLREALNQYPRRSEWLLPTRLGNALRAGETYGWSQYRLSTVDLWTRLTAVVDDKINQQLKQSRAVVDFFVALIALSLALLPTTVAVAVWADDGTLLLWIVALVALLPVWYGRAVAAVAWYSQSMEALADLGRTALAEALGLRLPGDLAEERKIWRAVTDYAAWGPGWGMSPSWSKQINEALMPRGVHLPKSEEPS